MEKLLRASVEPDRSEFLDPIRVERRPDADPPRCDVDASAFEKEVKRLVEKYKFNALRVVLERIDCADVSDDSPLAQADVDDPRWQAAFADYGRKVQERFRELGLFDALVCDRFDEPGRGDYELVAKAFGMLKRYFPDVRTLSTEKPSDEPTAFLDDSAVKSTVGVRFRRRIRRRRPANAAPRSRSRSKF